MDAFVAGARMTHEERVETQEVRRAVEEVLVRTDVAREDALRRLHAFVSTWMAGSSVRSEEDWKAVAARSAEAAWLRARVSDVDERALLQCARLLADQPAAEEILHELEVFPVRLPARLAPYFPEAETR
jgi:hypothetical protein